MNKSKTFLFLSIISTSIYCQAGFFDIFSSEPINSCASDPVMSIISDLVKEQPDNLVNRDRVKYNTNDKIKNEVYLKTLSDTQISLINVETYSIDESTGRINCNAQVTIDEIPLNQISYETFILDNGDSVGVRVFENLNETRYGVLSHTFNKSNLQNKSLVFLTTAQIKKRDDEDKAWELARKKEEEEREKEAKAQEKKIKEEQAARQVYLDFFQSKEFKDLYSQYLDGKIDEAIHSYFDGNIEIGSMKLVEEYKSSIPSTPMLTDQQPSINIDKYAFLKSPDYLTQLAHKSVRFLYLEHDTSMQEFAYKYCDELEDSTTQSSDTYTINAASCHAAKNTTTFDNTNKILETLILSYIQKYKLSGLE